jgi:hypothetical protein
VVGFGDDPDSGYSVTGKAAVFVGRKKAVAAVSQMRDGVVEMEGKRRSPIRVLDEAPDVRGFYDRDAELKAMEQFMESDAKALVVLGNRGYGTSALCRKFLDDQEESDVLWISMGGSRGVKSIEQALVDFGKGISKDASTLRDVLDLEDAIIVFDDYFEVSEEVVEFLSGLMGDEGEAKLIITARQETPAYNWFYRKEHVDSGRVRELRVKGLDEVSAMKLLGNPNLEKDALKRIMMITRGQPLVLRLLRDGDQGGLRKNTVFTAEEIGYLTFLKDKTG